MPRKLTPPLTLEQKRLICRMVRTEGLTQTEVSKRMNLNHSTVSRVITNNPTLR